MLKAIRARFSRQTSDSAPAESRQMKRAKKVQSRNAREANLKKAYARDQARDSGGGQPGW